MKQKKWIFGALGLGVVVLGLSSCTNTFCSDQDRARMLYAFDVYSNSEHVLSEGEDPLSGKYSYGISTYYDEIGKPEDAIALPGYSKIFVTYNIESNKALVAINEDAVKNNIRVNDYTEFWRQIDDKFLDYAVEKAGRKDETAILTVGEINTILLGDQENNSVGYGYWKYLGKGDNENVFWSSWNENLDVVKTDLGVDYVPDSDYIAFYKSTMEGYIGNFKSCLATTDGFYGYYGYDEKMSVYVSGKDWKYAWSRGVLEGLIVFPIGWLIDNIAITFLGNGVAGGWAQVLSILLVTIIIRAVMLLLTINQTLNNAKMSELQPEIAKIQAKYPNANTNKSEQSALGQETQALYKKNKINPFLSIIVMLVQFPVFIAVWGAMTGSAVLTSNDLLGLRLSDSVSNVLFSGQNGWVTALILFIIMAAFQAVSMLLPQIINKRKAKSIVQTGKNPNADSQNKKTKWFTIIMLIFIIFMGFSLASGMIIYWVAGSIWTIFQTLIIEWVNQAKKTRKRKPGQKVTASAGGQKIEAEIVPEHMSAPTGKRKFKDKKGRKNK
ncbi:MAG: membrane protein insertase YidC [Bacilli bacterium]